jgi:hypothetical protein
VQHLSRKAGIVLNDEKRRLPAIGNETSEHDVLWPAIWNLPLKGSTERKLGLN